MEQAKVLNIAARVARTLELPGAEQIAALAARQRVAALIYA